MEITVIQKIEAEAQETISLLEANAAALLTKIKRTYIDPDDIEDLAQYMRDFANELEEIAGYLEDNAHDLR